MGESEKMFRARGLCRCGSIPIPGKIRCLSCDETQRRWRRAGGGKRSSRRYLLKLKRQVFSRYGGQCSCCGESKTEFLQIDHINNDGADHRRKIGKGSAVLFRWLRAHGYPSGFQILCANCNMAKAIYGVCPHKMPTDSEIDTEANLFSEFRDRGV